VKPPSDECAGTRERRIGTTCSYAPLPLLDAVGFVPERLFPTTEALDRAGTILHDNLCPHVKRVLDRFLAGELEHLEGVLLVDSCDAMRRMADALAALRPRTKLFLLDLPTSSSESSESFLAGELERLAQILEGWAGRPLATEDLLRSLARYTGLAGVALRLSARAARGRLRGGRGRLQELLNRSVSTSPALALEELTATLGEPELDPGGLAPSRRVPLFLFGNVLFDPRAFELFESCGALVVGDALCSGTRLHSAYPPPSDGASQRRDLLGAMARALLSRPACARTVAPSEPGRLARQILEGARTSAARGVVAHVAKFCDPYLVRMPALRGRLEEAGLPLLVLEGDCTLRSLGQQRTRLEAFVEMLGGSPS
jgi:benzoyl-CoA reductase subunit C